MEYLDSTWLARPCEIVSPELIGCILVRRRSDGQIYRGMIVETEAYVQGDPACHGHQRQTRRNAPMFGSPGLLYVYLIYGIHHCLNLVTDRAGIASAVLIRALALDPFTPPLNQDISPKNFHRLAAGPGKLCRVLGIDRQLSGQPLAPETGLWLEPRPPHLKNSLELVQTTRIGLKQGQDIPWRWYLKNSPAVSRP
ncbi:DNA-3-methyladenine glycosylase [Candidatus Synechococcus calcipolaris G9]|uniref:Putative 3-methyladenine DNA glycosylase n=1 Tax=Candidatus Synechococcus calcipolaris G9 TaxID=1497997 RepID=A0ABT6EZX4_9SYNE|nr:DNA-3-methyladenine glycosylase [Candidatus Synechococcus calcipolaris]MDG2991127.1 DNA-3-methyladenine glycosylase [Candidatus Synechococcus calcipolaris G9]